MFKRKALCQASTCVVYHIVPDETLTVSYNLSSDGQTILRDVAKQIDLVDVDYFGLRFRNSSNSEPSNWLDLTKPVSKQIKLDSKQQSSDSLELGLRFKFYPADQALLNNEATRYYLYLQLRLDLSQGKLYCESQETLAYLIACIVQSELGDYVKGKTDANAANYLADYKFVPNQTEELENAAIEMHKSEDFQGLSPSESETNFLKRATQFDAYGIDPFPVKERASQDHNAIGVNHRGVSTFHCDKKTNEFTWEEIERITFDNKLVLIYCTRIVDKNATDLPPTVKSYKTKPLFAFKCNSKESAFNFWKLAIEHRYFFTLEETPEKPLVANTGRFLKKNHKLKCSGRVERDLLRQPDVPRSEIRRTHSLLLRTGEGKAKWDGFEQGSTLKSSLSTFSSDLNKTMPASLEQFPEEEDENNFESIDHHQSLYNSYTQSHNDSVHRQSSIDSSQQSVAASSSQQPLRPFNRRSIVSGSTKSASGLSVAANNVISKSISSKKVPNFGKKMKFIGSILIGVTMLAATLIAASLIVDQDLLEEWADRYNLETLYSGFVLPARDYAHSFHRSLFSSKRQ